VAGGVAAGLLASWGHLVVLVERERSGARPPLAEPIPPSCIPLLDLVGVRRDVEQAGFVRGGGNTVWWGGAPMRVEPFPGGGLGFQVQREALERVVLASAERAGVHVLRPASALQVQLGGDRPRVSIAEAGGDRIVEVPWVLDCSGRTGVVGRSVRVPSPDGTRTTALVGTWEADAGWGLPDESHTLVESAAWGWGWSVPVSPTRRFFTAMVDPSQTSLVGDGREGLEARSDALLGSLPAMGEIVKRGVRQGSAWACEATPYHASEVAWPGALLVGDAASLIDPLSSFGVKKAIASAWLGAVVVHTAFVAAQGLDAAMRLYRRREQAYVQRAGQASTDLAREALSDAPAPFWSARAHADWSAEGDEPSVEALRDDLLVQRAFAEIRNRPTARFAPTTGVVRVPEPVVRGNVVCEEEHLVLPGVGRAVRYLRNVDLVALLEVAPTSDDVGVLYERYTRLQGAVPLPDFLGALSVLVARGALSLA